MVVCFQMHSTQDSICINIIFYKLCSLFLSKNILSSIFKAASCRLFSNVLHSTQHLYRYHIWWIMSSVFFKENVVIYFQSRILWFFLWNALHSTQYLYRYRVCVHCIVCYHNLPICIEVGVCVCATNMHTIFLPKHPIFPIDLQIYLYIFNSQNTCIYIPWICIQNTGYWHIDTLVLFLDLTYIYQYIKYVYPTYPISWLIKLDIGT